MNAVAKEFTLWKTITIGTGPETPQEAREALRRKNAFFADMASEWLVLPEARGLAKIDLTIVLVKELGLDSCPYSVISRALKTHGLDECPRDIIHQLCLQSEWHDLCGLDYIAMQPVLHDTYLGSPYIAGVCGVNSKIRIRSISAQDKYHFPGFRRLVCCIPRTV